MSTHVTIVISSYSRQVIIMHKDHIAVGRILSGSCQDKVYKARYGSSL